MFYNFSRCSSDYIRQRRRFGHNRYLRIPDQFYRTQLQYSTSVYTLSPCISYNSNNYHCCNSRADNNDRLHFHFPSYIYWNRNLYYPGQNLKQQKQEQNQKFKNSKYENNDDDNYEEYKGIARPSWANKQL